MATVVARLSIVVACVAAVACGSSSSSPSPTAPSTSASSPSAPPAAGSSGATILGTVAYAVFGSAGVSPARATDLMVSVKGTSIMTTVAGDGSFTLAGVPPGSVELRFFSSSVDARGILSGVDDEEQITVTVVINGGVAELTVQKSEIEGTVSGLTGACPAVTFTIGVTKISTDQATMFLGGGSCQQMANGVKAEATGSKQGDGSVRAATVSVEDAAVPAGPTGPTGSTGSTGSTTPPTQVGDVEGTIGSLAGSCPAVTFAIGSTKVSTDATTTFLGGTCGQLANGGKAEAAGPKQLDGSIKATTVSLEDNGSNPPPGSQEIQLDGTASALAGSCPVISFTVTGTKVVTDASTSFTGGVCQQVANGGRVQVKGFQQNDGSVRATEVSVKDVQETQLDGTVSALTGTCPLVTFAVTGTKVATDASTSFTGGACQQLANGQRVQARGAQLSDGSILATRVDLKGQ